MKTFEGQMTNFGKLRANMYVLQLRGCFVDVVPNKRRLGGLSFMGPSYHEPNCKGLKHNA